MKNVDLDNLLQRLIEEQNCSIKTLHMTANENILSESAKCFLSSNLSCRYYSDTYDKTHNLSNTKYYTFDQAMYRGLPAVYEFEMLARKCANKMFHANFSDFSALSGMHAVMCILVATTKPGDKVFIFTPNSLGHHATKSLLDKIGRKVLFIPWNTEKLCIDLGLFKEEFNKNTDATIFLDLGTAFYPLPTQQLREIVGSKTKIIYDGSHVLGLIAGGQFQNPLQEGCDILIGNTHKTFPGPQKAMMLFKDEELGRWVAVNSFRSTVFSQHTHHALALYVTLMEMVVHGKSYAAQIVKNAQALSNALLSLGFKLIKRENELPVSHMIAITGNFPHGNQYACAQLHKVEISSNTKKIFGKNSLRLGVQELTRRGIKEDDMRQIAYFLERVINSDDQNIGLEILNFSNKFKNIMYTLDDKYLKIIKSN